MILIEMAIFILTTILPEEPKKLNAKLENAGFKVSFTKPVRIYSEMTSNPNMLIGWIFAENDSSPHY